MMITSEQKVKALRALYPTGTILVLDHMDDSQAPPVGTLGTVTHVDDMGSIHMRWENGSSLALIPGEDQFHKILDKDKGD